MTARSIEAQGTAGTPRRVFGQSRTDLNRAWEGFLAGDARETLAARNPILDSWERCRSSKVSLGTRFAPQVAGDALEALRRDNRTLLRASAETLADASDILIGTETIMLVTDAEGVVLDGVGDGATMRAALDIALGKGGNWREGAAGTNGIGIALATAQPMLVHGGEHYCERMREWSCAAAPIVDPGNGRITGILNLSARSEAANNQLFALAVLGARRIEQALLQRADAFRAQLLEFALEQAQHYPCDGMIAVDATGRLAYASRRAARLLRDRLDLRVPDLAPGHPFEIVGEGVSGLPADWVKPIRVDGELGGYMVVIPTKTAAPARHRALPTRIGDEGDAARASFSAIVGESPALATAIDRARRVAASRATVLIEGETGVGKELFARAIHGDSPVASGPFVTLNCGAVTRELLASELFGYARGAFTGARAEGSPGRFELADGGTLCLDEIGELPLDLQPYLLRVMEEGVFSRVGSGEVRRADVRIIAMTNRDLGAEVAAGRFRRDLLHRLSIVAVRVPPLRERPEDIGALIDHFVPLAARRHGRPPIRLTAEALAALRGHDWLGNVRELRNAIETATLMAIDGVADHGCLPQQVIAHPIPATIAPAFTGEEDERGQIEQAIVQAAGNVSLACKLLGVSRSTLYRRMAWYGLDRQQLKNNVLRKKV